jgi:adenosylcobinamide-phosphate synthase
MSRPLWSATASLPAAAVAHIVGRDTELLDEAGSLAPRSKASPRIFQTAIVAPVFWMAIAGLPGAALYKAINTADSMIGHHRTL